MLTQLFAQRAAFSLGFSTPQQQHGRQLCMRPVHSMENRYRLGPMKRIVALFSSCLTTKALPLWIFVGALLLTIPALYSGLMLDDYPHQMGLLPELQREGGPRGDWDLFRFQGPDRAYFQYQRELGLWPWWTTPTLRLAFFRPLSSWHHALDYRVWPGLPWLMHLESMVLYGLIALTMAVLFRKLLGPTLVAGLAALLFVIDDSHSMVVMWIANRNALWAVLWGVLCLLCFHRHREGTFPAGAWLGPLCFLLGLLSGETALGAAAYLFSYVVWLEKGTAWQRLRLLLPYVAIGALWAVVYALLGYGTSGSGLYIDPAREPLTYLSAVLVRLPLLLCAQLGLPPADLWMQVPPSVVQKVAIGAWLLLTLLGLGVYRLLRGSRQAAFFAMGMVLALLPVCSVWPMDRLLLFSSFGAFGLLAMLWLRLAELLPQVSSAKRLSYRVGIGAIVLLHVVMATVLLPYRISFTAKSFGRLVPRAGQSLPTSDIMENRTVVMVNSPDPLVATYSLSYRYLQDRKMIESLRMLSSVLRGTLHIERTDARTLILWPSEGFLQEPLSRVFRSPSLPMDQGEEVRLSNLTVKVLSVSPSGIPQRVSFQFAKPLEDSSYLWLTWKDRGYESFHLPLIGESVTLPAIDYRVALGIQ